MGGKIQCVYLNSSVAKDVRSIPFTSTESSASHEPVIYFEEHEGRSFIC